MATLTIGLTASAPELGGTDPDVEALGSVTLTNGVKVAGQATLVAASTPTTSTVVWQAMKSDGTTQHAVSGAASPCAALVLTVDPDKTLSSDLAVGVRVLYTSAAGAALTDVGFQQRSKLHPLVIPGSVRDSSDVEYFPTKIEVRNRNTTAVPVQVDAWN